MCGLRLSLAIFNTFSAAFETVYTAWKICFLTKCMVKMNSTLMSKYIASNKVITTTLEVIPARKCSSTLLLKLGSNQLNHICYDHVSSFLVSLEHNYSFWVQAQPRMLFVILSALATGKWASPIGFLSVYNCPPFVLLTVTQRRCCPKIAVAAADSRAAGLGRVGHGYAADTEGRERTFVIIMGIALKCNWHKCMDACFTNSSTCDLYWPSNEAHKLSLFCSISCVDKLLRQMRRFSQFSYVGPWLSSFSAGYASPWSSVIICAGKESMFIASRWASVYGTAYCHQHGLPYDL